MKFALRPFHFPVRRSGTAVEKRGLSVLDIITGKKKKHMEVCFGSHLLDLLLLISHEMYSLQSTM